MLVACRAGAARREARRELRAARAAARVAREVVDEHFGERAVAVHHVALRTVVSRRHLVRVHLEVEAARQPGEPRGAGRAIDGPSGIGSNPNGSPEW